ncbi:hydroxyacid dehydrogenase [bacterium]|nr:hydroxyacid dehydrogenase [bacterium]MBU1065592.1 hydroxyacid dehydrogenase [bacterium]MBU1632890.1 hydroxyacid dehydrogenase [bacterium]MBU1873250.1 hydroxyacid dehydrogenase [bacterium]
MDTYDVYFYEAFDEEEYQLRHFLPNTITAGFTYKTIQECDHPNAPAKIISTRTQTIIPDSWLTEVKAFLTRSTGYDYYKSVREKADDSVQFGYLPLYCNRSVAEQAMLLWMALMRKLPTQMKQFNSFYRDGITGLEVQGKTLLVVGVGNIGYEIVRIARGLDMNVYGVDIDKKHTNVDYVKFADKLPRADIIVTAMNLTPANTGYFNYEKLKNAKPGALFINIARGEESVPSDLKRLLDEGILGGVAMDVYPRENLLGMSLRQNLKIEDKELKIIKELATYPNVILTPHNAFNTEEAVVRKSEQSVQQVIQFLKTGQLLWNVP